VTHPPPLSAELIARAHPELVADDPNAMPLMDEAAMDAARREMLGGIDGDIWLFGYGSLMWFPDLEFAERRRGRVFGWHRNFCLRQWRHRGSPDAPGLVLALDRGGSCPGAVFRIAGPEAGERLAGTWRREMRGMGYRPLWMRVTTSKGVVTALGFVANRASPRYTGRRSDAEVAREIAHGRGAKGASATYLFETWRHCREKGMRDPMLERLAALVALELTGIADRR
jgi:cation transport protein ChaC